jgi:hypothetical protein
MEKLLKEIENRGFIVKEHNYHKFGIESMPRTEYIATDGNVYLYIEKVGRYFLAVATDEKVFPEGKENGVAEYVFYYNKSLRSNKLYICNNDHSYSEIIGAIDDYKKNQEP